MLIYKLGIDIRVGDVFYSKEDNCFFTIKSILELKSLTDISLNPNQRLFSVNLEDSFEGKTILLSGEKKYPIAT